MFLSKPVQFHTYPTWLTPGCLYFWGLLFAGDIPEALLLSGPSIPNLPPCGCYGGLEASCWKASGLLWAEVGSKQQKKMGVVGFWLPRLCYVDTLDGWLRWQVRNGMPLSSPPACAIEMARAAESIYQETKNKGQPITV